MPQNGLANFYSKRLFPSGKRLGLVVALKIFQVFA